MTDPKNLAAYVGPILLAAGLALLINAHYFPGMLVEAVREPLLVMLAGFASFIAGIFILRGHPRWRGGWPVLLTVVGWVCIITGLLRILFPLQAAGFAVQITSIPGVVPVVAVLVLVAGAVLSYQGYRHVVGRPGR